MIAIFPKKHENIVYFRARDVIMEWVRKMAEYSEENIELFQRVRHGRAFRMLNSHFHDKNELYYLESGETRYWIGGEIYFLKPGDMIFVPKGVFHQTNSENETQVERLLFAFDDGFAGEYAAPWLEELKRDKFVRFPSDKQYRISELIRKIEREGRRRERGYIDLQRACLLELLVTVSRLRLRESPEQAGGSDWLIRDAARYIAANVAADLSLTALSKKYAVSKSYFSRRFKRVIGVSLCEYVNTARVSSAERLLAEGSVTVTEAALRSGFNDSNYFASVFKRMTGITPKKYSLSVRDEH